MTDATEKPPLVYDELEVGREFRPLVVTADAELVQRYLSTLSVDNALYRTARGEDMADAPCVPPGLWGVWGRAAYLVDNTMPPGGVLAGEDLEYDAPLAVGQQVTIRARVADRYVRKERPNVVFESVITDAAGTRCGAVRILAIWPPA